MKKRFKGLLLIVIVFVMVISGCGTSNQPKVVWEQGIYDDEDTYKACCNAYRTHIDALLTNGNNNVTEVMSTGLISVRSYIVVDDWDKRGTIEFWDSPGVIKYDKFTNTVTLSNHFINIGMLDDFAREVTTRLGEDNDFYNNLTEKISAAKEEASTDFWTRYDSVTGEKIE